MSQMGFKKVLYAFARKGFALEFKLTRWRSVRGSSRDSPDSRLASFALPPLSNYSTLPQLLDYRVLQF